jgi:hypothetical protein
VLTRAFSKISILRLGKLRARWRPELTLPNGWRDDGATRQPADDDLGTSQKGPIAHAHFAVMVGADAHAA